MKDRMDLARIVSRAQQGDKESLESLVAHVRPRVMVYLYRTTLDHHLAQDLTQETMLKLIQSLPHLRTDSASSLWAWIYRTALGKAQHHFQRQERRQRSRHMTVDHDALDQLAARRTRDALDQAQRKELIEAVSKSLEALKHTYRHVLVLRCFEQLSFAEIAHVFGTSSELRMRLLFFRAKQALARQLHNRGFGRRYFLPGLTLFATITALRTRDAGAAKAVTAEMVKAGTAATAIGTLTAPWGLAAVTMLTATLVVGAALSGGSDTQIPTTQENLPWVFPSGIVNAYDPDGSGWERLIPDDLVPSLRRPFDLNTIVNRPGQNFFLILPEGHWIELDYGGCLADGPGPDVQLHCLKDNVAAVFLTDGGNRTHPLSVAARTILQNWACRVEFDLARLKCPFIPTALRIEGKGPPTERGAAVLINVQARVVPQDGGRPPQDR